MLPLGFSIGTVINAIFLWGAFEREFRGFSAGVMRAAFESLGASCILGGVAYAGLNVLALFFSQDTLLGVFSQGFVAGLSGIAAAALILILLKSRELSSVWAVLRGKFWRARVVATDPEIV